MRLDIQASFIHRKQETRTIMPEEPMLRTGLWTLIQVPPRSGVEGDLMTYVIGTFPERAIVLEAEGLLFLNYDEASEAKTTLSRTGAGTFTEEGRYGHRIYVPTQLERIHFGALFAAAMEASS